MTYTKTRANANTPNNMVSVLDFGAKGNNGGPGFNEYDDDAINAAIASGADAIYFPPGRYWVRQPIVIERPLTIMGAGSSESIIYSRHSGNCFEIGHQDIGTDKNRTSTYLTAGKVTGLMVSRTIESSGGAAFWLRQCGGWYFDDVTANNHDTGFRVSGGQLNTFNRVRTLNSFPYVEPTDSSIVTSGIQLESTYVRTVNNIDEFQKCFTVQISDWIATSSGKLVKHALYANSADGLSITGAYLGYFRSSHLAFKRINSVDYITVVQFTNVYCDGVESIPEGTGGTPSSLLVRVGDNQLNTVRNITFTNCFLGNNRGGQPIVKLDERVEGLTFDSCTISGCDTIAFLFNDKTSLASYTIVNCRFTSVFGAVYTQAAKSLNFSNNSCVNFGSGKVGVNLVGEVKKLRFNNNTFDDDINLPLAGTSNATDDYVRLERCYYGKYVPDITPIDNCVGTPFISNFSRYNILNDSVVVNGEININTLGNVLATFSMELPIPSNFARTADLNGSLNPIGHNDVGAVVADWDTPADRDDGAMFSVMTSNSGTQKYTFSYSYSIIDAETYNLQLIPYEDEPKSN